MLRIIAVIACALFANAAAAQSSEPYPSRNVRLIVGFPPGGSTDITARLIAARLSMTLGQAFVVENRAGVSGSIAAEAVARSAPDGYTLLMAATSFAAAPAFTDKLAWDPVKDFSAVSLVGTVPILAVTTPALNIKTPAELVAYSKANPGKMNLASPGPQTLTRLSGEQFKQIAGLDWVTVHYKGGAPAMQDMIAGQAQVMFANISDVLEQVRAGKLNAVAITTRARSVIAPDIPTFAESGYPQFSFLTWQALVGPAGMPKAIVDKLNAEIRKIVADPEFQRQMLTLGTEAAASSPEELSAMLAREVEDIRRIARAVGAAGN